MDTTISPAELASDFRFALDVMEESDHLGLDDEHARLLHDILERRIAEANAAFSSKRSVRRVEPLPLPIDSKLTL